MPVPHGEKIFGGGNNLYSQIYCQTLLYKPQPEESLVGR